MHEQICFSEGGKKGPIAQRNVGAINEFFHFANWMEGNPMDHRNDITNFLFSGPACVGIPVNIMGASSFSRSLNALISKKNLRANSV